jgi:hypothetical protein
MRNIQITPHSPYGIFIRIPVFARHRTSTNGRLDAVVGVPEGAATLVQPRDQEKFDALTGPFFQKAEGPRSRAMNRPGFSGGRLV